MAVQLPNLQPEEDLFEGGGSGVVYADPQTGKYNINGTNILRLAARKAYDAAPFSSKYTGEEEIQKADTNTNTTYVTLTGYKVNGTTCTAVASGHMPKITSSPFWSSDTAGTYVITRTNTSLTIGSSVFYPDDFRDNVIPKTIVVFVVGGGGGGGGNGYFKHSKGVYYRTCSGAGGGGGYAAVRINIENDPRWTIKIGSGGSVGNNGASDANSKGAKGGDGTSSTITVTPAGDSTNYVSTGIGRGGVGGNPGDGSSGSSSVGSGGAGGGGTVNNGAIGATGSGGGGNYYGHHNESRCQEMTFTPTSGTGDPGATLVSSKANNLTDKEYDEYWTIGGKRYHVVTTYDENLDDPEGDGSYFSGGCSSGYGAYPYVADVWIEEGSIVVGFDMGGVTNGGGGGGGSLKSAGASGYAAVYY